MVNTVAVQLLLVHRLEYRLYVRRLRLDISAGGQPDV